MKIRTTLFLSFFLSLTSFSSYAGEKIEVMVSIPPLAEFVQQVGGERINVKIMVPPGANPHTYEPAPNQLKQLSHTQLFVAVGSGIEFELTWLDKIKNLNPGIQICDASKGIERLRSEENGNDPDGRHRHGGFDPHTWLSPINAVKMAQNIENAISSLDQQNKTIYEERTLVYINELRKLDQDIRSILSKLNGLTFTVYHPAWAYFAKEYGLKEVAIEFEGKEPGARRLSKTIESMRAGKAKTIFASPLMSSKSAEVVARESGAQVELIDELAQNYIDNLRMVSKKMANSLNE